MADQTILWTALPNGIIENGTAVTERALRLSVYVSPRLRLKADEANVLESFQDFLNWPETINQVTSYMVRFGNGQTIQAFPKNPSPLRPDLWTALFSKTTPVQSHAFEDNTGRLIISYPAGRVLQYIKSYYQEIGFKSFRALPIKNELRGWRENLSRLNSNWVDDLSQDWTPRTARALRDQLHRQRFGVPTIDVQPENITVEEGQTATAKAAPALNPADRPKDFQKMLLFHTPTAAIKHPNVPAEDRPKPPPLPRTPAEFQDEIDFHQAISSLGDYPELMRYLGLVIDLEIPADQMPTGETTLQVVPEWTSKMGESSISRSAYTTYIYDGNRFEAAPRSPTNPAIENGLLKLKAGDHELVQVDVDGAAIKAVNFAVNLSHELDKQAEDTPEATGLPALRTAGFSLMRTGADNQVYEHFGSTSALNSAFEAGDDITLYAEDLVRGYRIDVWNALSDAWYSLNKRVGTYAFTAKNIQLKDVVDEGFVQMGMTQAPPEQPGEKPSNTEDLYVHESLFHWEGWSLVAPRPGKSIVSQEGAADRVESPKNDPLTAFKLSTDFRAAPRTLPKLRFGVGYRLRARVVDLAGNSIALNEADDSAALPAPDEPASIYLRYEPVAAPNIVLRKAITEDNPGESLERLVIRTFNNNPSLDTQPISEVEERHIAPPRSSQQMLEALGVFDGANGQLMNDANTYNFIVNKDKAVDPNNTESPVEPAEQMPLSYLHDVLAVGAALRDLPNTPEQTIGQVNDSGSLVYDVLPGVDVRPGSVTHIAYGPTTEMPKGLLALYTFDEGGGDIVHDVSSFGKPLHLKIANPEAVTWGTGKLAVNSKTIIREIEPCFKLITAIKASNALTIEAWITPANITQNGPARIVTIGDDPFKRNVTLGQGQGQNQPADLFDVRLRTTQTDENGAPSIKTQTGTAKTALTHVVFTRRAGEVVIYVNGIAAITANSKGDLSNWTTKMAFALACEPSNDFPWLGTYHLVAIYDRALSSSEVQRHYKNGPVLEKEPIPMFRRLTEAKPFRLALAEGHEPPTWDADKRILTAKLPKAEMLTMPLSSYMDASELKLMGVWEWIREYVDQLATEANSPYDLEQLAREVADMTQYAIEGGFWMLTPARQVTLVHAVQQPIGHPMFLSLTSTRQEGKTVAKFIGQLRIHGKSTAKVDLSASWQEPIDNPLDENGPTVQEVVAQHVAEIPLKALDSLQPLTAEGKTVGQYEPDTDRILLSETASPEHKFGDTKHRMVTYWATSSSRYQEYFEPDTPGGFSRASEHILVNVPASERPSPPKVRYVIPTYGWKRQTTTNMIASQRQGGGLRVYLERPWYSSGEGELLGVVLWNGGKLNNQQMEDLKHFITQWGQDPIWASRTGMFNQADNSLPSLDKFTNQTASGTNVWLPELQRGVHVAGHSVDYDPDRQLWYCDIEVDPGEIYYPFIRLALVRYQPHALQNVHLSPVVLADFAQLAPNRSTVVTYDPYNPNRIHVSLAGFTYQDVKGQNLTDSSRIEITVEIRSSEHRSELDWEDAGLTPVQQTGLSGELLWGGYIDSPEAWQDHSPGQYRIVIREYEQFLTYDPNDTAASPALIPTSRLVYADIIPL